MECSGDFDRVQEASVGHKLSRIRIGELCCEVRSFEVDSERLRDVLMS